MISHHQGDARTRGKVTTWSTRRNDRARRTGGFGFGLLWLIPLVFLRSCGGEAFEELSRRWENGMEEHLLDGRGNPSIRLTIEAATTRLTELSQQTLV